MCIGTPKNEVGPPPPPPHTIDPSPTAAVQQKMGYLSIRVEEIGIVHSPDAKLESHSLTVQSLDQETHAASGCRGATPSSGVLSSIVAAALVCSVEAAGSIARFAFSAGAD